LTMTGHRGIDSLRLVIIARDLPTVINRRQTAHHQKYPNCALTTEWVELLRDRYAARCVNFVAVTRIAVLGARSAPRETGNQPRALAGYQGPEPLAGSDQVALVGVGSGGGATRHAELVEDIAYVARHGLFADEQLVGNGAVRFTGGHEA
jgi:hypothetical protein